ncbi:hypothetical protein B9Z55_027625 [Caenorhabditis nigoni]|nr:hypothetical protein B9Z55_027625 [Caenorhabditis nigoni]
MSFSSYCRECATHFADQSMKNQHVSIVHHGITPPNPAISEDLFYCINSHVPQVRARTCPICLIHFADLGACIFHVDGNHPTRNSCSLLRPTKEAVIFEWERLVETVFPGAFSLIRKRFRIVQTSSNSDLQHIGLIN